MVRWLLLLLSLRNVVLYAPPVANNNHYKCCFIALMVTQHKRAHHRANPSVCRQRGIVGNAVVLADLALDPFCLINRAQLAAWLMGQRNVFVCVSVSAR